MCLSCVKNSHVAVRLLGGKKKKKQTNTKKKKTTNNNKKKRRNDGPSPSRNVLSSHSHSSRCAAPTLIAFSLDLVYPPHAPLNVPACECMCVCVCGALG
ncbi:hypothetical protein TRSC58_07648 [Trypanosoma rangeli SC58]|uniref:Uncharacterized protein n=1 Tax=Trypanosoma rangeli SC58 TaxID=429131 RepID=A0A061IRI8_TRYRA|nr:hypothetical protein TRSC58_07648 [Trypanosoma rangeli SC58]